MPVHMDCPHCAAPCHLPDEYRDKTVRCYRCRLVFTATPPAEEDLMPEFDLAIPVPTPLRLDLGCATSRGKVRERNEDSLFMQQACWMSEEGVQDLALLVVADGMGGYRSGDRASQLVVRTVATQLQPVFLAPLLEPETAPDYDLAIQQALQQANTEVRKEASAETNRKGMGATAVVVLIRGVEVWIAHVGDCRVYHLHAGKMRQVTRDQTLVERLVDLGQISPAEARVHPARNEVSQAIGKRPELEPARNRVGLETGDWLVLACDGLTAHLEARDVESCLHEARTSASLAARLLVERADEGGGSDNTSVIVVRCH